MKKLIMFLSIVICLFDTHFAQAQKLITGTVRDAETGEVLLNASVKIENTLVGTMSDSQGNYALSLWQLPAVVLFSHVGYVSLRIVISETSNKQQSVTLTPRAIELEELNDR